MVSHRLNSTLLPNLWPSFVIFHVSQVKLRVLISGRLSQELWGVQVFSWGRWTRLYQGVLVGNLWQCSALNFPVAGASHYFLLLHPERRGMAPREQGQGGRCSPINSYRADSQLQSQGDWPQHLAGAAGQDPSATTHPKMTIQVHCLLIKRCQQQTEKGGFNSNPNLLLSCQSYLIFNWSNFQRN